MELQLQHTSISSKDLSFFRSNLHRMMIEGGSVTNTPTMATTDSTERRDMVDQKKVVSSNAKRMRSELSL